MADGSASSALLISSTDWVHRRVHVLDHTQPGRVLIQETLDVQISEQEVIPASKNKVIIPIAILPKGVLRSWWVQDDHALPLSVVRRTSSSKLMREMLLEVLERAGIKFYESDTFQNRLLDFIDNGENTDSRKAKELIEWCNRARNESNRANIEFVIDLISVLESSWVVLVEIPNENLGQRMIIRYGYDLKFKTNALDINEDNDSYRLSVMDPGFSHSLHCEVRVPPELEVYELSLVNRSANQKLARVVGDSEIPNNIAHIQNDQYIPRFSVTNLEYRLRPSESGIRQFTYAALTTVVTITFIVSILHFSGTSMLLKADWRAHTTASVVLVLPALLLSWIARAPEPEVVRRAFHRLRLINIYLAIAIFSVAVALSTMWKPIAWNLFWYIPVICCVIGITLRYLEYATRIPTVFGQEGRIHHG